MMNYKIQPISYQECLEWCLYKHYAKRIPPIEYKFGLFDGMNILQGIITYGTPVSNNLRNLFDRYKLIELNRLCVNDGLPKNSLSWFVSNSLKLLPRPLVVVSYADTSMGHHGYIYQATNWVYTGLSAKRTDVKIEGFGHMHSASIMDMSRGKENRMEYLRDNFGAYLEDRPRKHRYFYFIGSKTDVNIMRSNLPYPVETYPKGDNSRYDSSHKISPQLKIF